MRRAYPIIAALLAYLMVPGAIEIVENVAHLVTHGDAAHADAEHSDDGPRDEHGCSAASHACGCHGNPSFVAGSGAPDAPARPATATARPRAGAGANDSGFVSRLLRPPRSMA